MLEHGTKMNKKKGIEGKLRKKKKRWNTGGRKEGETSKNEKKKRGKEN